MLQLMVTLRDRMVLRRAMDQDLVRVGRAPTNEVHLDTMAVSREHCVLRRDAARGTWTVEDLGSANGTFLNGARVQGRTEVRSGDALTVGPFSISIRAAPAESLMATAVSIPGGSVPGAESPEMRELQGPKAWLEPRAGGSPILLERDLFQVGADPALDLFARGPRKLALIVRGEGGFQLVNVGPDPAAVRLDGVIVPDRLWLRDGAQLQVGDVELRFHAGAPEGGEQTLQMKVGDLDLKPRPRT